MGGECVLAFRFHHVSPSKSLLQSSFGTGVAVLPSYFARISSGRKVPAVSATARSPGDFF